MLQDKFPEVDLDLSDSTRTRARKRETLKSVCRCTTLNTECRATDANFLCCFSPREKLFHVCNFVLK